MYSASLSVFPAGLPSVAWVQYCSDIQIPVTVLVEMFSRIQVTGKMPFDDLPEALRVVHLGQMRQFVNDDVVDDFLGRLDQPPVQSDLTFGITTTPLGACI